MLEKIVGLVSSKNDNEKEGVLKKSVKTLSPPISSLSPKVFIPHPEVFFPIFCHYHLSGIKMPPIHDRIFIYFSSLEHRE